MTTRPRAGKRALALLLLPLMLLLAGCFRMEMAFTINADDSADIRMEMVDKTGSVTREELDCQTLVEEMDASGLPTGVEYTVEELDEDGNLGCSFAVTGAPLSDMTSEGLTITEADGVYTFALEGDDSVDPADLESLPGLEVVLAVTFPGTVIDAGGGEVEGSTVTWSDPAVLVNGVTATGEAAGEAAGAAPDDAADDGAAADSDDAEGTSWWWWALGALVLLAVVAVVVALVVRSSRQGRGGDGGTYDDLAGGASEAVPGAYGVPGQPGVPAGYGQPVPPTTPGAYGVPGQPVAPGTPGQPTAWAAPDPAGQPDPPQPPPDDAGESGGERPGGPLPG